MVKKGDIVECICMDDPHNPVPSGTRGVVEHIDDIGQIHVKWDNGSSLALTEIDTYKVIKEYVPPIPQPMKSINKCNKMLEQLFVGVLIGSVEIKDIHIGSPQAYGGDVVVIEADVRNVCVKMDDDWISLRGTYFFELCSPSKCVGFDDEWAIQLEKTDDDYNEIELIGWIDNVKV